MEAPNGGENRDARVLGLSLLMLSLVLGKPLHGLSNEMVALSDQ